MPRTKRKCSSKQKRSVSSSPRNSDSSTDDCSYLWLQDFDKQFELHIKAMDEEFEAKLSAIRSAYRSAKMRIPPHIGNKPFVNSVDILSEFRDSLIQPKSDVSSTTVCESMIGIISHKKIKKLSSSLENLSSLKGNDTFTLSPRSSSCSRTAKKVNFTSLMPTASKSKLKTPVNAIPTHNGLSVVTPKVQANASSTLLRYPRQGEMAISMSGSPLLVTSVINDRTANVSVPLLDGRIISILPQPNLQPYEVPAMSEETEGQLETLKMNINTLLKAYKSSKNN